MIKKIVILLILILPILMNSTEVFLDYFPMAIGEGTAGNINSSMIETPLFFYNPAVNSGKIKSFIAYEHKFLLNNLTHYNSVIITIPVAKSFGIGLGYINQNIDNIPIFPEFPDNIDSIDFVPQGYFSDNAHAAYLNLAYTFIPQGYSLFELSGGINIKYIIHQIYTNTGMGSGIDAGMNALFYIDRINFKCKGKLNYFLVIKDIGSTVIKWDTPSENRDERKYAAITGIGYSIDVDAIMTQIDIEMNAAYGNEKKIGLSLNCTYNNLVGIYGGINYRNTMGGYEISDPAAGVSLYSSGFEVYYSLSYQELGLNHSVSLGYSL